MTANNPSTPETAPGGPQERLEGVSAALASPEAPSGAQAPADGLGLRERITQTIRDTPARYPDDIAAAVWRVVQTELAGHYQHAVDAAVAAEATLDRARHFARYARDRAAPGLNDWQNGQHELAEAILDVLNEQPPAHNAGDTP